MSSASRVFELRTYHAAPGKFDALHARFRDHTCALFEKHGFTMVGFWTPLDGQDVPAETLVYLLAFRDRSAADELWWAVRADPEWIKAKASSTACSRRRSNRCSSRRRTIRPSRKAAAASPAAGRPRAGERPTVPYGPGLTSEAGLVTRLWRSHAIRARQPTMARPRKARATSTKATAVP
jgi:hypothetical protein